MTRTQEFEKQTKIKLTLKKKSLKKGRLQLWRRTTTQREWERSMWLENQKREVDKWLIDDKEGWVIKSKRNVKGLDNPYENTRKTNWNDVVIRYKTLWINKTQHLKSRKKKIIGKMTNANYLRWKDSWKRTGERTTDEKQMNCKPNNERTWRLEWNKNNKKENERRRNKTTNMKMMEERFQKNVGNKQKQGKRVRTNWKEEGTETQTLRKCCLQTKLTWTGKERTR